MTGRAPAAPPVPSPVVPGSAEVRGQDGPAGLAAQCIQALLDRAALPRHRHSAHVSGLLGLSYHQARRRMSGTAPWSVEEMQAVAAHHGETLTDLFSGIKGADYEAAVLAAGALRVGCRILPGSPVELHRPGELIAVKGGSEWVVVLAGDTPTPHAYTVRRIVVEPKPQRPRRIAILDDDYDIARGLAAGFVELGYEATAFASEDQLDATLKFDAFDGYVIDWVLAKGTAEVLVGKLRSHSATCPIALLTGKAGTRNFDEKALVAAIEQHGLLFLQKPVTASLAASQFSASFANR